MPKICLRYAQDMLKIFPKYAQYMPKICPVYMQSVHFVFCTVCPPWISPYNLSTRNQNSPYNLHILHPFHVSLQWAASPPISCLGISLASCGQLQPPCCRAVQVYSSIRAHAACLLSISLLQLDVKFCSHSVSLLAARKCRCTTPSKHTLPVVSLVIEWMESIQWPDRTLWYKEKTANCQSQPLRCKWRCVTTSSTYYPSLFLTAELPIYCRSALTDWIPV